MATIQCITYDDERETITVEFINGKIVLDCDGLIIESNGNIEYESAAIAAFYEEECVA